MKNWNVNISHIMEYVWIFNTTPMVLFISYVSLMSIFSVCVILQIFYVFLCVHTVNGNSDMSQYFPDVFHFIYKNCHNFKSEFKIFID